ncbi:hypothetical protein CWI38_0356p0010 [Hamiltosporidium tvaerminnensis]|uniref:SCD domain-containing protein n=1 Tax=Hamiltosporidium tvaerminnensis TaxID=1176355 RepID=A0A4Q9LZ74_9MICR|nr:hypothetical protein CWI38_0356p0010 [Hamiltosporidium tvaerminnensis]
MVEKENENKKTIEMVETDINEDLEEETSILLSDGIKSSKLDIFDDINLSIPQKDDPLVSLPVRTLAKTITESELLSLLQTADKKSSKKISKLFSLYKISDFKPFISLTSSKTRNIRFFSTICIYSKIKIFLKTKVSCDFLLKEVFLQRIKDIDPNIRSISLDYLCQWILVNDVLVKPSYLRYIGLALNDKIDNLRKKAVKIIIKLIENKNIKYSVSKIKKVSISEYGMENFSKKIQTNQVILNFLDIFMKRIIEISLYDKSNVCRTECVVLIICLYKRGFIERNKLFEILKTSCVDSSVVNIINELAYFSIGGSMSNQNIEEFNKKQKISFDESKITILDSEEETEGNIKKKYKKNELENKKEEKENKISLNTTLCENLSLAKEDFHLDFNNWELSADEETLISNIHEIYRNTSLFLISKINVESIQPFIKKINFIRKKEEICCEEAPICYFKILFSVLNPNWDSLKNLLELLKYFKDEIKIIKILIECFNKIDLSVFKENPEVTRNIYDEIEKIFFMFYGTISETESKDINIDESKNLSNFNSTLLMEDIFDSKNSEFRAPSISINANKKENRSSVNNMEATENSFDNILNRNLLESILVFMKKIEIEFSYLSQNFLELFLQNDNSNLMKWFIQYFDVTEKLNNNYDSISLCYGFIWLIIKEKYEKIKELNLTKFNVNEFSYLIDFLILFKEYGNVKIENSLNNNLNEDLLFDSPSIEIETVEKIQNILEEDILPEKIELPKIILYFDGTNVLKNIFSKCFLKLLKFLMNNKNEIHESFKILNSEEIESKENKNEQMIQTNFKLKEKSNNLIISLFKLININIFSEISYLLYYTSPDIIKEIIIRINNKEAIINGFFFYLEKNIELFKSNQNENNLNKKFAKRISLKKQKGLQNKINNYILISKSLSTKMKKENLIFKNIKRFYDKGYEYPSLNDVFKYFISNLNENECIVLESMTKDDKFKRILSKKCNKKSKNESIKEVSIL